MQSAFIGFKFGQVHYSYCLSGKKKTLLFLHAFQSSAQSYETVCELLSEQYNVVCLGFPGHGLSARVDVKQFAWYYSVEGFASVVAECVAALALSDYTIIGDSVGGNCAVRLMNELSGLSGLVLMGSVQASSVEDLFALHHQSRALELLFKNNRSQQEDEMISAAYVNSDANQGRSFQLMLSDIQNTDPSCREYFAKQLEAQQWVDELALVKNAPVPIMYVLGEDDGFIDVPSYKAVLLDAGLNKSNIHVIKNARHVPPLDDPEVTAGLIAEFVKS